MKLKPGKYNKPTLLAVNILLATGLLVCCKQKKINRTVEPAFYYWKSTLNITAYELQQLDSLKVKTLYIKFFDVDWNNNTLRAEPVAKLQTANFKLPEKLAVIPTVFITNECIQKIDSSQIGLLASNIYQLIKEIRNNNNWKPGKQQNGLTEIQIDCDWTASTKEKYFRLLNILNEAICFDGGGYTCKITCTIRLHQIKFMGKTGVPPVSRGLLMCYNMGNLKNPATVNSIIEKEELEKYTVNLAAYPLPLDVALPLFDWKVLFRNNMYSGLLQNLPDSLLSSSVALQNNNRFSILKDTVIAGYDLKKGDLLREEKSDYKEVLATALSISNQLKNTPLRVSLYHLDSVILKKYSAHELETLYNSLH